MDLIRRMGMTPRGCVVLWVVIKTPYFASKTAKYGVFEQYPSIHLRKAHRTQYRYLSLRGGCPLLRSGEAQYRALPKGHREKLAYVLHLILKSANESELPIAEIEKATIESFYEENKELCTSFELAKDNFGYLQMSQTEVY